MNSDEPGFTVTLRDVWEAQQETNKQVAALVEQLPAHVTATAEDIKELREQIKAHEARIQVLDAWRWKFAGVVSGVFLVTTVLEAAYYFTHH